MIKRNSQSLDLISDASFISENENSIGDNLTKQVRFDLFSHIPNTNALDKQFCIDMTSAKTVETKDKPLTLPPFSTSPSESLNLSVVDEPFLQETLGALSLDTPKMNTLKVLQEEVIQLANRVYNASHPAESTAGARRAKAVKDIGIGGVCVNFAREKQIYTDLMDVSLSDDEVVRAERNRVAYQRRRLYAEEARLHPPKTEILPEPCLMKFFDPQRHIFQSARLDVGGSTILQGSLEDPSTADQMEDVMLDYRLFNQPAYFI